MFSTDPLGDYKRINSVSGLISPINIKPHTPQISDSDKSYGEIVRYFIRFTTHTSPSDIIEVSKSTYVAVKKSKLYTTVQIRWKITGQLDDKWGLTQHNIPIRLVTGVITANKMSVQLANDDMPGIIQYITDYKRFWEP